MSDGYSYSNEHLDQFPNYISVADRCAFQNPKPDIESNGYANIYNPQVADAPID